jgi:riboflavin-specific deaminase-like protein
MNLTNQTLTLFWDIVLEIRKEIPNEPKPFSLAVDWSDDYKKCQVVHLKEGSGVLDCKLVVSFNRAVEGKFDMLIEFSVGDPWPSIHYKALNPALNFMRAYVPYLLLRKSAQVQNKSITIGHLAMSLDGRIATSSGNSQWIGNQANLIHSHRMRALSDAILVGGNTFLRDQPQLNVRHVEGENPVKIIMGDGQYDFSRYDCDDCTIWVNSLHPENGADNRLYVERNESGFNCNQLLTKLYQRGIQMVFIEGGGVTLSGFIQSRALDILQLHYAPILMGSGVDGLSLAEIERVDEALTFSYSDFEHMDEEWMFTGVIDYKK